MELQKSLSQGVTKAVVLPVCSLCDNVPTNGIRDGIKLKKLFICSTCEYEIVNMEVGSEGYEKLLEKIKRTFR